MAADCSSYILLRAAFVWLTVAATAMTVSLGEASSLNHVQSSTAGAAAATPDNGLVHVELIPFHAHQRRLRRERQRRRLKNKRDNDNNMEIGIDLLDANLSSSLEEALLAHKNRPDQYARRTQQQVAELFQGYGTHYVDLWIGTPNPQRQTVIVDTGSGVTAFPCSGCRDCGVPKYHSDGLFDQTQSSTFKKLSCGECLRGSCSNDGCTISMSYQEGSSWSAFESQDQCYAGGLHYTSVALDPLADSDDLNPLLAAKFAFPLKFGCQIKLTGLFITQLADGIMGLDNAKTSYVEQMKDNGIISTNSFSLCYSRQDVVDADGTESGAFTMGGTDKRLHNTPMVFTSAGGGSGFYAVQIVNIYLREGNTGISAQSSDPYAKVQPIGLSASTLQHGRVIVDSGTTDTYFSRTVGTKFNSLFRSMAGVDSGHDRKQMTLEEVQALPTILIQLEGDAERNQKIREEYGKPVPGLAEEVDPNRPYDVLLAVPPTHYMEYDPDEDTWTNRFYTSEPAGGVIGGNAIMGHDVFFDADNRQIGWAESDCDYTSLMAKYKFAPGVSPSREENKKPAPAPTPMPIQATQQGTSIPVTPPSPKPAPLAGGDGIPVTEATIEQEEAASTQFCSTLSCQGALVSIVVVVAALVAWCAWRGNRRGPAYELSPAVANELELQDSAGNIGSDGIIRYRDEPSGAASIQKV